MKLIRTLSGRSISNPQKKGYVSQLQSPFPDYDSHIKDLSILELEPNLPIKINLNLEGTLFRQERQDSLKWLPEFATLQGDLFSCYQNQTKQKTTYSCTISYACIERTSLINPPDEQQNTFYQETIILFSKSRRVTLAFQDKEQGNPWISTINQLMLTKFSSIVLKQKNEIMSRYHQLWIQQLKDLLGCPHQPELAFADAAGLSSNTKVSASFQSNISLYRQPDIQDSSQPEIIKLYACLYPKMLYLFNENEETGCFNRKTYSVIPLSYVLDCESKDDFLYIQTPLLNYEFRCISSSSATEWTNHINRTTKESSIVSSSLHLSNRLGYIYSGKQLQDISFIGRSQSTDVQLSDPGVSRCHCKVEIYLGAPFLVCIGPKVLVNGVEVVSEDGGFCLKPGDVIRIAETELIFGVKKGVLFHLDPTQSTEITSLSLTTTQ